MNRRRLLLGQMDRRQLWFQRWSTEETCTVAECFVEENNRYWLWLLRNTNRCGWLTRNMASRFLCQGTRIAAGYA